MGFSPPSRAKRRGEERIRVERRMGNIAKTPKPTEGVWRTSMRCLLSVPSWSLISFTVIFSVGSFFFGAHYQYVAA